LPVKRRRQGREYKENDSYEVKISFDILMISSKKRTEKGESIIKTTNILPVFLSFTLFAVVLFPPAVGAAQMADYTGQVLPVNHALNTPIDSLPIHPNSDDYIDNIGANTALHSDLGTYYEGHPIGISYNLVGAGQPPVSLTFEYESDSGPYPIPIPPLVEGLNTYTDDDDGDRHILVIDTSANLLYETWYTWPPGHAMPDPEDWETYPPSDPNDWWAGSGAIFDFTSNALRPDGWTSADAAGLPIFPLLIRYDEVERAMATDGVLHHAIRFTVQRTRQAYIWPARHFASRHTNPYYPPMGLRFRLKANVDISGFTPRMQVILRTMKKYGIIVADNGSNWFFQGTHDDRWDDDELGSLKSLHGRDFEVVDISSWMERPGFDSNSAAVPPASGIPTQIDLRPNKSNLFTEKTTINYHLTINCNITLKIYDMMGKEIKTLIDEYQTAGQKSVEWDGTDRDGKKVPSGTYFYQISVESGNSDSRKIIFLK
jgi:hypothetical protein